MHAIPLRYLPDMYEVGCDAKRAHNHTAAAGVSNGDTELDRDTDDFISCIKVFGH